jgi:regulation of enolase protein 1 (concanavalin A-like superfamily)
VKNNPNANTNAPRLVQPVDGNFTVETEVDFTPKLNGFQGAAIVIWLNSGNFVRLEISAWNDQFYGVNFIHYDTSDPKGAFHDIGGKLIAGPPTVELRVKRTGDVLTASWQQFSSGWRSISTTFKLTSHQVLAGLLLMNAEALPNKGRSSADAYFHYFHYTCDNA